MPYMTAPASKDWREVIAPDEEQRFNGYAEQLLALQRRRNEKYGTGRSLHRKGLLGVEATFEVTGEGSPEARAGIFAQPGTYAAYVRFSNGSFEVKPDGKADIRGMAIKVMGVAGKKVIPGLEDKKTQDFLLIQLPSTAFKNADEFMALIRAASNPLLALPRLLGAFGFRAFSLLAHLSKALKPVRRSLATTRFFSAVPIRCGDHAAKLVAVPSADGPTVPDQGNTFLAEDLAARLARGPVVYDLHVQLFRDEKTTPIEDASVIWSEADAPRDRVARITLTKQDPASERGKKVGELIEQLSFDPWHALVEHRPLGDMMRARNYAYRLSTKERKALPEPDEPAKI